VKSQTDARNRLTKEKGANLVSKSVLNRRIGISIGSNLEAEIAESEEEIQAGEE
jgi:hypothetical protein